MCERSASLQSSEAGFSLIEALIGFAVLAMVLTAVFSAGMLGLRMATEAGERTEALLEARSLIDRIGLDLPLTPGSFEGRTALGRTYHLIISPIAAKPDATLRAYLIAAHIEGRGTEAPLVSLRTLRTAQRTP